jgi:hypothetical protein
VAKIGSSAVVIGLTACALSVVTTLALQAKSSATAATASGPRPGVTSSAPATHGKGGTTDKPIAVPADSGAGKRVVYSLSQKRVWLVDPGSDTRTFTVQPSTVGPLVGTDTVYFQRPGPYIGSDGVNVEDGVLFAVHSGVVIGFSAAVDGSTPAPDPSKHTGGVRETVADGKAMYDFAVIGTKVVVVP